MKTACAVALGFLMSLAGRPALAHGSLAMDEDLCVLTFENKAKAHFAGYQPKPGGNEEFCEDIPDTGKTIIVLDLVDSVLRSMPISVDISPANGGPPLFHADAKLYPNGTIPVRLEFPEKGQFVGIVTAGDSPKMVARFPFSVGTGGLGWQHFLHYGLIAVAALAALSWLGLRQRRKVVETSAQ